MLNIKTISRMGIIAAAVCLSAPSFATEFVVNASSSAISPNSVSAAGETLATMTLGQGESIDIKCRGGLNDKCVIGQFIAKTNYNTKSDCPKAESDSGGSNCAKLDNDWKTAVIYSDTAANGVLVGPIEIRGEYTYRIKNIGGRNIQFVPRQ